MALSFSLLSPFPSPSILALPTTPASTLHLSLPSKPFTGVRLSAPHRNKHSLIVSAAAAEGEAEASSAAEEGLPPSVDKLPLESKVKEREEQRARMKLAKKIRLRRKRLLRKRRLRKKGRWPPSKMKKLKNV
ncbi:50S ribosomal protein 5, chloroplastic isoform X2 [Cajanus cajan]|uniref:50S ribosomal protein 5, chloroplastic isoform X2 n=1 Tax=Cajanus cajan TaxID=3821 RepID=UPI00098D8A1F|nr:50S ribosomal protein 5, chloroplastic isoform X2 [Cajanus cajan]